jgi:2-polyprenyl-6-hydroxyphenyl methylase/3-demethylubiquinone-9 3-methyltransferase
LSDLEAQNLEAQNLDPQEQQNFDEVASAWWDPEGPFRPLHDLNPTRLQYICEQVEIKNLDVLDVGCGGGILAESMAEKSAKVTAIDIAPRVLEVAKLHLLESGQEVDYRQCTVEQLVSQYAERYDLITCMEMLEHVPDPASVIQALADLVKPGGSVFLSTLNRTSAAFILGIVGAEHIARILPRGTHRYDRFIRPSELSGWLRGAGLSVKDISGIHYNPAARFVRLGGHVKVNYLVHAQRPGNE